MHTHMGERAEVGTSCTPSKDFKNSVLKFNKTAILKLGYGTASSSQEVRKQIVGS
jgi:hypothetical protein